MSIRKLNESELLDEVGIDEGVTVPQYIERISMIIRSEEDAIAEYDVLLKTPDLPDELKNIILEIQNDEKDHLVLLTNALSRYTNTNFSGNTSELKDLPYPTEINNDESSEDLEVIDV